MTEPALTDAEHQAVRMAGELYTFISKAVCGYGPTRDADLAEICADIHRVQRAIEANAAARAYPREFRLLGEVIASDPEPGEEEAAP